MNPDRFLLVKELFRDASRLDGPARAELVTLRCDGDVDLEREVLELLDHARAAGGSFLAEPPRPETFAPEATFEVPGYVILEMVAAGGAGLVYRALQLSPQREVALKVLRLDTLGPGQVERFRREAEILAALNHPGIAQVYGAGVVESGSLALPWIAMEFVRGEQLDDHLATRGRDDRGLLELFRELCSAVDHAHERGIVHRDLKPSNVRVESGGRPRVLDFGIARITRESVGPSTRTGTVVGTLAYMAPEQARGERAIDARADVYALGMMIHEAFAGKPPLAVDGLDVLEAVHAVCSAEPQRLARVRPDLPPDLDAVVGMALEKDPDRRYARAGELAADLANVLAHRPVRARAPNPVDHARKFVRRNRATTIATTLVVLALATGLTVALIALRNQARQREVTSETIGSFAGLLSRLGQQIGFGEDLRDDLAEVLERIDLQLVAEPASRPLRDARARVLYELASLDQSRREHAAMLPRLQAALAIREDLEREDPTDAESSARMSQICAKLGEGNRDLGDPAACAAWFARSLAIDERLVREHPGDPEYVEDLGWSLARSLNDARRHGDHDEAFRIAVRRVADARMLVEREPDNWKYVFNLSSAHSDCAQLWNDVDQPTFARAHVEEALRHARRLVVLEPGRRAFAEWLSNACRGGANVELRDGRLAEARALADDALAAAEDLALREPRTPAHLDLVRLAAGDLARAELGDARIERSRRAVGALRRVAEVAERVGSPTADLTAAADRIELELTARNHERGPR